MPKCLKKNIDIIYMYLYEIGGFLIYRLIKKKQINFTAKATTLQKVLDEMKNAVSQYIKIMIKIN